MKKILLVIFTVLMISSCSTFSKKTSDELMVVINNKNNTLEVDNYNGKNFNMRVINAIPNSDKYKVSNNVLVGGGSHLYKLYFNTEPKESVDSILSSPAGNTMYISTAVTPNKEIENAYSIYFKSLSTVNLGNIRGQILFNSLNTDNFFRVIGVSSNTNNEISTVLVLDPNETVTIGSFSKTQNSKEEVSSLNVIQDSNNNQSRNDSNHNQSTIKIDYDSNQLIVDNNIGKAFNIKLISLDTDRQNSSGLASGLIKIGKGKHVYKLLLHNVDATKLKEIGTDEMDAIANTLLIYTQVKPYSDKLDDGIKIVSYKSKSNLNIVDKNVAVLFNSHANPNLFMQVDAIANASNQAENSFDIVSGGASVDVNKKYKGNILLIGKDKDGNTFATSGAPVISNANDK